MPKHKIVLLISCLLLLCLTIPAFAKDLSIDELRQTIAREGLQWVAGETSMSKLPLELRKLRHGLNPNIKDDLSTTKAYIPSGMAHPDSLDYRNKDGKNWLTPIKDQGGCGSCWCFGQVGIVEVVIKMTLNLDGINPDL